MKRTLTAGQIQKATGINHSSLYRLVKAEYVGRDGKAKSYRYNLAEVRAGKVKWDAAVKARQFAKKGKPRKFGRGKATDVDKSPNWGGTGNQHPVAISPYEQRDRNVEVTTVQNLTFE